MLVIPALELRGERCVRFAGDRCDRGAAGLEDPLSIALDWAQLGFSWLHVVDLDAALGHGSNTQVIREILREVDIDVQVGGGVRSIERIEELLADGAARVVVGTRAMEDPWWLEDVASRYAHQLVVACDVRDRRIVTHDWTRLTSRSALDALTDLNQFHLGAVLVSTEQREGQMTLADLSLMEDVREVSETPVFGGGGVRTVTDLRSLADRGLAGCVVGMPHDSGEFDGRSLVEEFGA